MRARSAVLADAAVIEGLIAAEVEPSGLLPRTAAEICETIDDFVVVEDSGQVVACGALHLYGLHLAEVRSISVRADYRGKGVGRVLMQALLAVAERQHVTCICLFTRIPAFFSRLGFRAVERASLPEKVFKDCLHCPKLYACDEVAMLRGELPEFAVLAPARRAAVPLVRIQP